LLTRELQSVYDFMDHGSTGIWPAGDREARQPFAYCVARRGRTDERADNAIKFLSDMFSARLYKVAASKIGVTDYKDLVNQKVHTARALSLHDRSIPPERAFVLELMVVIILIIDLIWLFKGSTPI